MLHSCSELPEVLAFDSAVQLTVDRNLQVVPFRSVPLPLYRHISYRVATYSRGLAGGAGGGISVLCAATRVSQRNTTI